MALLVSSLLPSVSLAFSDPDAVDWLEVCSINANTSAAAHAGDDTSSSPAMQHTLEHCTFCSIHVHTLGLPPAPSFSAWLMPLGFEAPALFFSASRTLNAWIAAQPRGPPAQA